MESRALIFSPFSVWKQSHPCQSRHQQGEHPVRGRGWQHELTRRQEWSKCMDPQSQEIKAQPSIDPVYWQQGRPSSKSFLSSLLVSVSSLIVIVCFTAFFLWRIYPISLLQGGFRCWSTDEKVHFFQLFVALSKTLGHKQCKNTANFTHQDLPTSMTYKAVITDSITAYILHLSVQLKRPIIVISDSMQIIVNCS